MLPRVTRDFTWHDGERTIRFGRGALAERRTLLGDRYVLLTTPRAAAAAPAVVGAPRPCTTCPPGAWTRSPASCSTRSPGELLVALGGGRVIDVAKALAGAPDGAGAAAIPTTLSAAEMTRGHRQARGRRPATPRVRPPIVLNDPALSASQPAAELAASARQRARPRVRGPLMPRASPVPTLAAREAARLLARDEDDRDALALGALLSGYAMDASGYGLHHVLAQTLARFAGVGHGPANAAMLPLTTAALRERRPPRWPRWTPRPAGEEALARRAGPPRRRAAAAGPRRRRGALGDCVAEALATRGRARAARRPPPSGRSCARSTKRPD